MIRIGTAGFSYRDWRGIVYPDPSPPGFDPLALLSGWFDCIEMNTTFYRVPGANSVAKWVAAVAGHPRFRFTFKLYRGWTHGEDDPGSLDAYLKALEPCREAGRLGAILAQFPFFFRNTQASRRRLAALAAGLSGWPCVIEVRDRSWLEPAALDFVDRLGLGLCAIDICRTKTSVPPGPLALGPIGYVRLHGRNAEAWFDKRAPVERKYDYLYSAAELEEWSRHIREIAGRTDSVFVITNNHFEGKAVANAFQLARLLGVEAPPVPKHLRDRYPLVS